jgi:hypothetical protein
VAGAAPSRRHNHRPRQLINTAKCHCGAALSWIHHGRAFSPCLPTSAADSAIRHHQRTVPTRSGSRHPRFNPGRNGEPTSVPAGTTVKPSKPATHRRRNAQNTTARRSLWCVTWQHPDGLRKCEQSDSVQRRQRLGKASHGLCRARIAKLLAF